MVGRANSSARGRRLMLGVIVALALLVVIGRIQRGDLVSRRTATTPASPTTAARALPVTATIRLGAAPAPPLTSEEGQLMVGEGGLWVVQEGTLVRVDPRRPSAMARIRLGDHDDFVRLLAVGAGAAWVATGAGVIRVDAATTKVVGTMPADAAPQAAGAGSLWSVYCASEDGPCRLLRIDPHTNRVSATTPLANLNSETHQAQLAVGAGSVWVEGQHLQDGLARAVIDRVDPANGRLSGTIETGDLSPAALAVGFGALWLLRPAAGALLRLDPAAM